MPTLTIATFNCENLFRRYKFSSKLASKKVDDAVTNGFILNRSMFVTVKQPERSLTAKAIKDTNADIVALQEIENLDTLKNFISTHRLSSLYPYRLVIDGNDPRLIDVAVISKYPFERIVTHQFTKDYKKRLIFSRDCLELEFLVRGKPFYLFVNHLKSMFSKSSPANGRKQTAARRRSQVNAILKVVKNRLGKEIEKSAFAIVGDFNDYPSKDSSLKKMHKTKWLTNIVENLPENERWTHFWDTSKIPEPERYSQLDYIWFSSLLTKKNKNIQPVINRKGLSKKAKHPLIIERYPDIEKSKTIISASDHCPVSVKFRW